VSIDPTRWVAEYGYYTVFVMVFIETAGIPLPGETTLLLAGAAASAGSLSYPLVVIVGAVAAIFGDNTGYAIGRFGGRKLVMRLAHVGGVASLLGWGEQFFERHGGKTVFLARWTAGLRIFGAWIAGMTRMRWSVFLLWNTAGGITWALGVTTAGYLFAHSLARIESYIGTAGTVALGVVTAALGVWGVRQLHRRQLASAADDPDTPGD
jgi:membrane protein DedA with SNARE-associated domain